MNLMKLKSIYKDLGVDYKESLQESTGIVTISIFGIQLPFRTQYFFNKDGDLIEQRDSVRKGGSYCLKLTEVQ